MKKGFTLIELLTIIVILAVILTIGIMNILNRIESSRKDARVSQFNFIVDAARKYAAMNEESLVWINNQTAVYLKDIQDEKLLPNPLNDPTGGEFDNRKPEGIKVIITRTTKDRYSYDLILPEFLKYYFDQYNIGADPNYWDYRYKNKSNYFVGPNPNNWLEFGQISNAISTPILWRVIKSDEDGIKIIYEGTKNGVNEPLEDGRISINGEVVVQWDDLKINKWERPASLKTNLEDWVDKFYVENKDSYLEPTHWCIGAVPFYDPTTLDDFLYSECSGGSYPGGVFDGVTNNKSVVALISPHDYISTSNSVNCNSSYIVNNDSVGTYCGRLTDETSTNFLYKSSYHYWTMNAFTDNSSHIWAVYIDGYLSPHPTPSNSFSARPVLNLKSNVLYGGGSGTLSDPYRVK